MSTIYHLINWELCTKTFLYLLLQINNYKKKTKENKSFRQQVVQYPKIQNIGKTPIFIFLLLKTEGCTYLSDMDGLRHNSFPN